MIGKEKGHNGFWTRMYGKLEDKSECINQEIKTRRKGT